MNGKAWIRLHNTQQIEEAVVSGKLTLSFEAIETDIFRFVNIKKLQKSWHEVCYALSRRE